MNELNSSSSSSPENWIAIDGYHALTSFNFGEGGNQNIFKPDSGVPVKIFMEKKTGEIKLFLAKMFEK
ncbi:MAG: hypothetical protein M1407_04115 [Deltaproteobacteria bacterium]|nr:hypothetical protein [Deltaproteobacteria bacterium]